LLSRRFLSERHLFPYHDGDGALALAISAPTEGETVRAIEIALRQPVSLRVATAEDIDAALASSAATATSAPPIAAEPPSAEDSLDDLRDLARGAPVVRAIDDLLRLAVEQRATDLHIEPFGNALQVRLRVDGLLRNVAAPSSTMARGLLSRLKIMA